MWDPLSNDHWYLFHSVFSLKAGHLQGSQACEVRTTAVNTGLGSQGRGREAALGPSARAFPDYFCCVLCAEFFDSKAMSRAEKSGDMDIRRSKNPVRFPTNLSGRGQYLLGLILGLYLYPSSGPCKLGVNSGQASNLASCGSSTGWLKWWTSHYYTIASLSLLSPESWCLNISHFLSPRVNSDLPLRGPFEWMVKDYPWSVCAWQGELKGVGWGWGRWIILVSTPIASGWKRLSKLWR